MYSYNFFYFTETESWYYELNDIKNSPSVKDGISFELETRYRSEGAKFISTIGGQLKLYPYNQCFTFPKMVFQVHFTTIVPCSRCDFAMSLGEMDSLCVCML